MSTIIVASIQDPAGLKVKEKLLKKYRFKEIELVFDDAPVYRMDNVLLATSSKHTIYSDHVEGFFNPYVVIFVSKHKSESGVPALLVHTPGNWSSNASFGGRPGSLCNAFASAVEEALLELKTQKAKLGLNGWRCGLEVTHHGPYFEKAAALFIELGGTEKEWLNDEAAEAVAAAAVKAASATRDTYRVASGFGGGHYAPRFSDFALRGEYAFAHIIPKYAFREGLTRELIVQSIRRSTEEVRYALVDRGLRSEDKKLVLNALTDTGVNIIEV
ncbi:MAG: D-aminoacyl-tRNA deacylase [Candidatus Nezhaarchaeales archaeon]